MIQHPTGIRRPSINIRMKFHEISAMFLVRFSLIFIIDFLNSIFLYLLLAPLSLSRSPAVQPLISLL